MTYEPPFLRTARIEALCMDIAESVGSLGPNSKLSTNPTLHRKLRISTIYSSLLVEGNELSLDQVTAIIDGKRVLGNQNDIREVENARNAYDMLPDLDPLSLDDLLLAHKAMMTGLVPEAGRFRSKNAGVFEGERLIHAGTPTKYVPSLMEDLFSWLACSDMHPLLRSCVFHYEFEFIHPFADGNGRTGRLWHTLLLSKWRHALAWLPVESVILKRQQDYYRAFSESESKGECGPFVTYMLGVLAAAYRDFESRIELLTTKGLSKPDRVREIIKSHLGKITKSEIIAKCPDISQITVQRALAELLKSGEITKLSGGRYTAYVWNGE